MPTAPDIRNAIGAALRAAADPGRAPQQQAYMKSEMPFLGVVVPQCRRIAASAFRTHPLPDADAWEAAILGLWRHAALREERYAAVELLNLPRCSRWIEPRRVPLIEELVVTGAWWDYVDAIAGRTMGTMLAAHPRPTKTLLRRWARSDNAWKRRGAILGQLRSKQATDRKLLADVIEPSIGKREFFLRKQGHRLGAARVLEDRSTVGDRVHRRARRPLRPQPARSAQGHRARAPLMLVPRSPASRCQLAAGFTISKRPVETAVVDQRPVSGEHLVEEPAASRGAIPADRLQVTALAAEQNEVAERTPRMLTRLPGT